MITAMVIARETVQEACMPVTVADLLNQERLGMRCVAGHSHLGNAVRWVHVSEVDDPTPWLRGGEMLITTNLYGREDSSLTGYFQALKASGVAALGYGIGWPSNDIPHSWSLAATTVGLPLLEIPFETPYIALSEFVAARQAAERARDFESTLSSQADLAASLLQGASESAVLARLANKLRGWAAIIDGSGHLTEETLGAQAGMSAISSDMPKKSGLSPLSASTVVHPDMEAILIPLGDGFEPRLLAVGREVRFDPLERIFISSTASLLALAASHRMRVSTTERRARALITEAKGYEGLLKLYGFKPDSKVDVALVVTRHSLSDADQQALEHSIAAHSACHTSVSRHPNELLIIAEPVLGQKLPWDRLPAVNPEAYLGVCRDIRADEIDVGVWNAATASRRALMLEEHFLEYGMLGNQDKLISMFRSEATTEFTMFAQKIQSQLEPQEIKAVRHFLAHNGNLETAASTLGVHRQTLRSRLQRAERRAGFSLVSPDDRSILWLALRE